jgi:hypothetical protein
LSRRVYLDFGTTNYSLGGLEMQVFVKGNIYEKLVERAKKKGMTICDYVSCLVPSAHQGGK